MLRIISGTILFSVGLLGLLIGFGGTKDYGPAVDLIFYLVFGLVPLSCGLLLFRSHFARKKAGALETSEKHHKEIFKLAMQAGGTLSIPEIVSQTSLSVAQAEEAIKQLVSKNYVEMKLTEDGVIVYEFFEIRQRVESNKIPPPLPEPDKQ